MEGTNYPFPTNQPIPDLYQALDVARHATSDDINKAFRKIAPKYHPDRNPDPRAAEHFKKLSHYRDILVDVWERALYDQQLAAAEAQARSSYQLNHSYFSESPPEVRQQWEAWQRECREREQWAQEQRAQEQRANASAHSADAGERDESIPSFERERPPYVRKSAQPSRGKASTSHAQAETSSAQVPQDEMPETTTRRAPRPYASKPKPDFSKQKRKRSSSRHEDQPAPKTPRSGCFKSCNKTRRPKKANFATGAPDTAHFDPEQPSTGQFGPEARDANNFQPGGWSKVPTDGGAHYHHYSGHMAHGHPSCMVSIFVGKHEGIRICRGILAANFLALIPLVTASNAVFLDPEYYDFFLILRLVCHVTKT